MKNLIAYCGLDCEECPARIATINNDDKLREETAHKWCEMNHTDLITPQSINCMGCRADGIKFAFCDSMCEIRKCAMSKGVKTCGDCCDLLGCEKVKMIIGNNAAAKERLCNSHFH